MPRKAIEITLTTEQKQQLEKIVRSHSAECRLVERAQIILECATGKQNQEVAATLACSIPRVSKWRRRFTEKGLAG
ncbi:helix-turn-helix domain-containing protein, partial [Methylicorpusculum sp.]|uniref:helix-turn-helix domain-containing protein n=1 Tax=Methylicorpusculum sp. TaxID=2713644 RepID=UPI00272290D4